MRVRITKVDSRIVWYYDRIGEVIEVEDEPEIIRMKTAYILTEDKREKVRRYISAGNFEVVDKIINTSNTISELFEQKIMEIRGLQEGEKVHYKKHDFRENGIIKSLEPDNQAFVVYKWGDDPEDYRNYTGILTPLKYLKRGWYES